MIRWFVMNPLKPDSADPVLRVTVPVLPKDKVLEPDRVPLTIRPAVPDPTVGLLPSGRLQSLPTVLVPAVLVIETWLNAWLPQDRMLLPVPSNVTVPPLALKVAPGLIVKACAIVIVPAGASNADPALTVKLVLKSAPLGTVTVPPVWL